MGVGVGCIFQPTLVALQAHSPKSRRAVIISNRNFYRCAGGACGLAISAAVLQARLRAALPAEYAYLADSTYSLPDFGGSIPESVLDAYMEASHAVFVLQVPMIGLCLLGMVFIRDRGLESEEDKAARQLMQVGGPPEHDEAAPAEAGPAAVDDANEKNVEVNSARDPASEV